MKRWLAVLATLGLMALPCRAERIKDIVNIEGVRGNPLVGYGLIVGLNGTGDDSPVSRRALANFLRRTGLVLQPDDVKSNNIASVLVTAELPAFAGKGSTIDVTVSTIGSATSLQGGTLLMTQLLGADLEVYAVAQGPISIGGFGAGGEKSSVTKNHTTVGRIPNGAIVEKAELATFFENGRIGLQLRNPDFATAEKIASAVNRVHAKHAHPVDAGTVRVQIPRSLTRGELTAFIARIGSLEVEVDQPAVVVINERTGTIVVGSNVIISEVAITVGSLSIVIEEKDFVSQPLPFSRAGTTAKMQRTAVQAVEEQRPVTVVPRKVSVLELAKALNAMKLTPREIIAIFQALREAGALQAMLKII